MLYIIKICIPLAGADICGFIGESGFQVIGMLQFNQFGIPLVGADICGFIGKTGFLFTGMLQFNQFSIPLVGADICGFIGGVGGQQSPVRNFRCTFPQWLTSTMSSLLTKLSATLTMIS
jgi:hypothetical protein